MKAVPTIPVADAALVMTGTGGLTVSAKFRMPVPVTLEAPRTTVNVPAIVAVPVIDPEVVLMLKPAGSPLAV